MWQLEHLSAPGAERLFADFASSTAGEASSGDCDEPPLPSSSPGGAFCSSGFCGGSAASAVAYASPQGFPRGAAARYAWQPEEALGLAAACCADSPSPSLSPVGLRAAGSAPPSPASSVVSIPIFTAVAAAACRGSADAFSAGEEAEAEAAPQQRRTDSAPLSPSASLHPSAPSTPGGGVGGCYAAFDADPPSSPAAVAGDSAAGAAASDAVGASGALELCPVGDEARLRGALSRARAQAHAAQLTASRTAGELRAAQHELAEADKRGGLLGMRCSREIAGRSRGDRRGDRQDRE